MKGSNRTCLHCFKKYSGWSHIRSLRTCCLALHFATVSNSQHFFSARTSAEWLWQSEKTNYHKQFSSHTVRDFEIFWLKRTQRVRPTFSFEIRLLIHVSKTSSQASTNNMKEAEGTERIPKWESAVPFTLKYKST